MKAEKEIQKRCGRRGSQRDTMGEKVFKNCWKENSDRECRTKDAERLLADSQQKDRNLSPKAIRKLILPPIRISLKMDSLPPLSSPPESAGR